MEDLQHLQKENNTLKEQIQELQHAMATLHGNIAQLQATPPADPNGPPMMQHQPRKDQESSLRPETFSGGYHPTFNEWADKFEEIATAHRWTGNRRAEILPAYLQGAARSAYRKLDDGTKMDYNRLRQALSNALQPLDTQHFYSQLLSQRKQQQTEDVSSYGADIERLVSGSYPVKESFDQASQDHIMCTHFVTGLRRDIKEKLLGKEVKTFQQAMFEATAIEAHQWILQGKNPVHQATSASENSSGPPHQVLAVQQKGAPSRQKPPKRYCNICFKPGHNTESCWYNEDNEWDEEDTQHQISTVDEEPGVQYLQHRIQELEAAIEQLQLQQAPPQQLHDIFTIATAHYMQNSHRQGWTENWRKSIPKEEETMATYTCQQASIIKNSEEEKKRSCSKKKKENSTPQLSKKRKEGKAEEKKKSSPDDSAGKLQERGHSKLH